MERHVSARVRGAGGVLRSFSRASRPGVVASESALLRENVQERAIRLWLKRVHAHSGHALGVMVGSGTARQQTFAPGVAAPDGRRRLSQHIVRGVPFGRPARSAFTSA